MYKERVKVARKKTRNRLPAIPPNDYEGTIADWMTALITRGLIKDDESFDDVWLTENQYVEILEECENGIKKKHKVLSQNKG